MDLSQKKLSRTEWNNIEVPFPEDEKNILQLIVNGFHDVDIKSNDTSSLLSIMKLSLDIAFIHEYLYNNYYSEHINQEKKKYNEFVGSFKEKIINKKKIKMKNKDQIKINLINKRGKVYFEKAFEHILLEYCTNILKSLDNRSSNYAFYLYSLIQIVKAHVELINPYVMDYVNYIIDFTKPRVLMKDVLQQSYNFIEKNNALMKYQDNVLFQHQKDIFTLFRYDYEREENESKNQMAKIEAMNNKNPKLVLYTAPTGTGKTLTPLGLSEGYRIIFICAARHIGLALAKSAVCMNKKIGIAFGCETVDDIRLHYYAASEYSKNKRSGGIGKVDNTVGDKVEIMICDVKSYIIAMRYMLAFTKDHDKNVALKFQLRENKEQMENLQNSYDEAQEDNNSEKMENIQTKMDQCKEKEEALKKDMILLKRDYDIITYWDEPTISMDYDEHPLHEIIQNVWRENKISKVVLSCATLPHQEEIGSVLGDFMQKFSHASIETISSFDCRKSISLLNQECKSVAPHLLFKDYSELQKSVNHCIKNKTMLRYFDLVEIIRFIEKCHIVENAIEEHLKMEVYFENNISNITMNSLKQYYLHLLKNVKEESWTTIYHDLISSQSNKLYNKYKLKKFLSMESRNSSNAGKPLSRTQSVAVGENYQTKRTTPASIAGLQVTTHDAQTLTDGPTIFFAENIENIGKYYINQTNLPDRVFQSIYNKIENNNKVQEKLTELEAKLEDIQEKKEKKVQNSDENEKKKGNLKMLNRDNENTAGSGKLTTMIDALNQQINSVKLDDIYVPNTMEHQKLWHSEFKENAFRPEISEEDVCQIMATDVSNQQKILLLLGIGMFTNENNANPKYMEIMKKLAYDQHLYLILASSDYIYGTNYQFCHGYIGKDLKNMTQQKTIQAMGRIGRNSTQQ